ncbi:MAG TPA: hypothetical protein VKU39_11700 [Streptosporangiaceae bacterium]|nr:hypothetical protein [Streptosporangiaceae bacterium]
MLVVIDMFVSSQPSRGPPGARFEPIGFPKCKPIGFQGQMPGHPAGHDSLPDIGQAWWDVYIASIVVGVQP